MRAIMVMYDSLRRDVVLDLPNFRRLAKRTVAFDHSYVCSMPCMPARRELHTGRANFLHRSWGPVEPFDDSMPELLKDAGIHTHLSTDHYHYIQDGGATYCTRYSTWSCFRGQESDAWKGSCEPRPTEQSPYVLINENTFPGMIRRRKRGGWQNYENRKAIVDESLFPQAQTFADGLEFIGRNAAYDGWFLQIETFDPHEPFTAPERFGRTWMDPDRRALADWPPYAKVAEDRETIESIREKYTALAEYCDECLGLVLDKMDELDLWRDTMLIVNTDHGFMLSEHGWWGKGVMPDYEELTHTPLYIWDPRCRKRGERRESLVQTIDLAPTLLDFFGLEIPKDMQGRVLKQTIADDSPVRKYGMFGYFGGTVNVTDGRYVYMCAVKKPEVGMKEYTLMPTHMDCRFSVGEMEQVELSPPFRFTKNCPVLAVPVSTGMGIGKKAEADMLFDLQEDPRQQSPVECETVKQQMQRALAELFLENEAPDALYDRYGLNIREEIKAV